MLEKPSRVKFHFHKTLKMFAQVYTTTSFLRFGMQELTHLWSLLPHGFLISSRDFNSCKHGSMMVLLKISGSQDFSSLNLSSQEPSRTSLESMLLPSIFSITTSRLFLMRLLLTLKKLPKMVYTFGVSSSKVADGMSAKKPLMSHCQRFCLLQWRASTSFQPWSPKLITAILTAAQFTNRQEELVLFQPLVTLPTSSWISTCQCRRSIKTSTGSREE